MAAWRYSASTYTPRDRSGSRESSTLTTSKYGIPSTLSSSYTAGERPSRWSSSSATARDHPPPVSRSNSIEEHGPVWAKTTLHSSPASVVQRLKDKYSVTDTQKATPTTPKRTDTKDLSLPLTRSYGRTTTSNYNTSSDTKKDAEPLARTYGDKPKVTQSSTTKVDPDRGTNVFTSRASLRKRSPEPEKPSSYEYRTRKPDYSPMESKPKIYTSSSLGSSPSTSRYLGKQRSSGSSAGSTPNTPTTPSTDRNYVLEKFERAQMEENVSQDRTVVMVTRGTSPTEPSASVYVRTRRADSAKTFEKTVQKPKTRPPSADKQCQTEEEIQTTKSIYSTYATDRVKPRASYLGSSGMSTYSPLSRYSGRTSAYPPVSLSRYDTSEFRRSVSREPPPVLTRIELESQSRRSVEPSPTINVSRRSVEPAPSSYSRKSVEPSSVVTPPIKNIEPLKSLTTASISCKSPVPQATSVIEKIPSPTTSTSETVSSRSGLKDKTKEETPLKKSDPSKGKSPSSMVITVSAKEKSKTPTKSDDSKRSRSKTQESDTSISVSGFSDVSKAPTSEKKTAIIPTPQFRPKEESSESESESESDETATTTTDSETDDDVEELTKSSEPSSIKRSITNFLQNLPNQLGTGDATGSRSRMSIFRGKSGSAAKFKFKTVESGEAAWWMDSTSDVPEGVQKLVASNKSLHHLSDKNHLAPNYMMNRQFSRDKDWLKNSSDDGSDRSGCSPLPPRPPSTPSPNLQTSSSPNHSQLNHIQGDNTLFLEVPNLPVTRQWSDEKPWWQTESDFSSKDNSISVDKELSNKSSHSGVKNSYGTDCDARNCAEDTTSKATCDSLARISPAKSLSQNLSTQDKIKVIEEDGEDIDVTPALRRRREQQQAGLLEENQQGVPEYQMKFNRELEEKFNHGNDSKTLLETECKLECSVRDLTQKLAAVTNGIASPVEEKANIFEAGDMSGMISKAKAGLIKSQTKQISRQNSDEQPEHVKDVEKSEIDIYWRELVDTLDRPLRLGDLDFTDLTSDDEKDIFGPSRMNGGIPPPPPPLMNGPVPAPPSPANPPPPLLKSKVPGPPPPPIVKNKKTVKLFWKEVTDSMFPTKSELIWDEILSVNIDGAKLEHLFESRAKDLMAKKQQEQNKTKAIIVLDNKRSNAINIGMTKLPPPRAIKAAILKMDSSVVTKEGIEKLLTMLPSEEERVRIQDAQAANPELPLGSAEQFLLTLASISELEARLKLWAFKLEFENSEKEICEPLLDLKQGIDLLRSNKTFRGILSTLLSIGNFLNGQEAKGFQIDYLSKVPEVKDTVNKHSLLHHLCVFAMEKFPDSTDLYSEIGAVTRASKTDFDELAANIKKLEDDCKCSWNHLKIIAKQEGQTAMKAKMSDFLADCAERIILIGMVHRRIMGRFHKFVLWLGVPMNRITTTRPQELFKTIAEFSLEYRTTRERILQQLKKVNHHREKSRTRCNITVENNHVMDKKLNSKEAKDDAKLRQLLDDERSSSEAFNQTATWRRHKKQAPVVTDTNGDDNEILETLIKTAKQTPSSRGVLQERRRSRIMERKATKPLD